MSALLDSNSLHRTAKYFMDNGRVKTHEEAMSLLERFGLTIFVSKEIVSSVHQQTALLTLVNIARRTLLGGVEVVGLADTPCLSSLAYGCSLRQAVCKFGARLAETPRPGWPSAIIGNIDGSALPLPSWRLAWNGWRGGVISAHDRRRLPEGVTMELAPIVAAASCAAEVFAYHARDHNMAGRRSVGLSLWRPGQDWLAQDASEAPLGFLPSRLWLIGLGNLGQAFAWALASLPYECRGDVQFVLQDYDRMNASNESTSVLAFPGDINRRKVRVVSAWLETLGFDTHIDEHRFGEWTRRGESDPAVALCGVDNAGARAVLGKAGFGLVVEAGLGSGPEAFRSMSVHAFPGSRSPEEIWSRQVGQPDRNFENQPAYQALKEKGMDSCGLAQLASRTVGVPFVGVIAACLAVSEILRRLNGGTGYELISASASALGAMETVPLSTQQPYAFGHTSAASSEKVSFEQRRSDYTPEFPQSHERQVEGHRALGA